MRTYKPASDYMRVKPLEDGDLEVTYHAGTEQEYTEIMQKAAVPQGLADLMRGFQERKEERERMTEQ